MELRYGLYLFKSGEGLSSGYSIAGSTLACTIGANSIEWAKTSQTNTGNSIQFQPAVEMSEFSKLHVELKCTGRWSADNQTVTIAATEKFRTGEAVGTWDTLNKAATKNDPYDTNIHIVSLDISSVSGQWHPALYAFGISGEVYNVWLE